MQQICDFCGSVIMDTDAVCPHCGAANAHVMRVAAGLPRTIQELKDYAAKNHLPLEKMRFYIGKDFKEPKAFGIYEKNGIFTVYKNKADGTRAIRYQGKDEAYAVNELYQKMHSEIMKRKQQISEKKQTTGHHSHTDSSNSIAKAEKVLIPIVVGVNVLVVLLILVLIISGIVGAIKSPKRGYYTYDDQAYYYQSGTWYGYDESGWVPVTPDSGLTDSYKDYYDGSSYQNGNGYDDFKDSGYYHEDSKDNDDDDWGNDDDWDSGNDWDSGGTDWDSDW